MGSINNGLSRSLPTRLDLRYTGSERDGCSFERGAQRHLFPPPKSGLCAERRLRPCRLRRL